MKKLKSAFVFLLGVLPLVVCAQSMQAQQGRESFWRLQHENVIYSQLSYSGIAGSPFLNSSFQIGKIFTNQKTLLGDYPLRYDVYAENFEFKKSGNKILEINNPEMVGKIILNDTTFIYTAFMADKDLKHGFFQVLNSGKALGLIRYSVKFLEPTPAGAYQSPKPARFASIEKDLYVRFSYKPAIKIHKNSEFLKLLPANRAEVAKFMKKHRIHVAREKDLVKLLDYYNSL